MGSINLTPEQRDAIIKIGSPNIENTMIAFDIIDQLLDMGILYNRGKDSQGKDWFDFTELGEEVYDQIKDKNEEI